MGAGVANQNDHIISIGFQGNYQSGIGIDVNTMSDAQFNAGVDIIRWVQQQVPAATRASAGTVNLWRRRVRAIVSSWAK